jgi:hypothetical protein
LFFPISERPKIVLLLRAHPMKPWVLRRSDLKLWYASDPSDLFRSRRLSAPLDIGLPWGMQMRCDSFLGRCGMPLPLEIVLNGEHKL